MLLDVATFCERSEYQLDQLVEDLEKSTRRSNPLERTAWRNSLPTFAQVMRHESLRGLHVQIGNVGGLIVEYRLPASPSWADVVLLGKGPCGPAAVIVELKDWDIAGDAAGDAEELVLRRGQRTLHPSDQVRGYTDYCQRFHSAVQERKAAVSGCVFFTYASTIGSYAAGPHEGLVRAHPVFARNSSDIEKEFPAYLRSRLQEPDSDFARAFDAGTYRQDRGFVKQMAQAIRRPETSPFVLLDQQRVGFATCVREVRKTFRPAQASARKKRMKSVVVVVGPPGSGKSVIAAHLWASLAEDEKVDGNVVLTTTSSSQRTNWEALFQRSCGSRASRGVVVASNQYNPGLNQQWLKKERESGRASAVEDWRENIRQYRAGHAELRCPDDAFAVSIVDEAHALIDPTIPGKRGIAASGWLLHAGPQAWHVIRASKVSIFLMDPDQSYRDNETTTLERIHAFAEDFDAEVTVVSLAGAQFRCAGSVEYADWIDRTLELDAPTDSKIAQSAASTAWRPRRGGPFEFGIAKDPQELEDTIRELVKNGMTGRLVASYARPWRTRLFPRPHSAAVRDRDFVIPFEREGDRREWTRIWNHAPEQDYSFFVQAPIGSPMSADQLCEVGCPYVVRGFDFDYVGLLWFSDLVWRRDRWQVQLDHVHESAWKLSLSAARKGRPGAEDRVLGLLKRGYRILLSRAIRGTYVWFEDPETQEHVTTLLHEQGTR